MRPAVRQLLAQKSWLLRKSTLARRLGDRRGEGPLHRMFTTLPRDPKLQVFAPENFGRVVPFSKGLARH
jgi:hypothetical protein